VHETRQRLEEWLKDARSKLDMGAYDLCAFRISLQSMLHRARVEQHAGFPNAESLIIRLRDINAAFAQKVEVAGSLRVMITRNPAKPATKKDLRRKRKVAENCRKRVHSDQ
jgi:HEPN domain-containing protein